MPSAMDSPIASSLKVMIKHKKDVHPMSNKVIEIEDRLAHYLIGKTCPLQNCKYKFKHISTVKAHIQGQKGHYGIKIIDLALNESYNVVSNSEKTELEDLIINRKLLCKGCKQYVYYTSKIRNYNQLMDIFKEIKNGHLSVCDKKIKLSKYNIYIGRCPICDKHPLYNVAKHCKQAHNKIVKRCKL